MVSISSLTVYLLKKTETRRNVSANTKVYNCRILVAGRWFLPCRVGRANTEDPMGYWWNFRRCLDGIQAWWGAHWLAQGSIISKCGKKVLEIGRTGEETLQSLDAKSTGRKGISHCRGWQRSLWDWQMPTSRFSRFQIHLSNSNSYCVWGPGRGKSQRWCRLPQSSSCRKQTPSLELWATLISSWRILIGGTCWWTSQLLCACCYRWWLAWHLTSLRLRCP